MFSFRQSWSLCGAVLMVITSCSSAAAPTATVAPTTTGDLILTAAPTTTVAPEAYRIGDYGPAGGTVFITPSSPGNTTGLYFEVAPFTSEVRRTWATEDNQRLSVPGASGTSIGDGAANSAAIARQAGNVAESSAAVYASEYSVNGFSDWFLPSKDELNELYENREKIGSFSTRSFWSSSEIGAGKAWLHFFGIGSQSDNLKLTTTFVRPVRTFNALTSTAVPISTVAVGDLYQIGDVGPAGGTIFITPSTPGNETGLYFEASPALLFGEVVRTWATGGNQNLSFIASATAIGNGAANTAAIARYSGNVMESAAVYASEYSINGFSDWFLPSKDELNEMYMSRASLGGFSTGWPYWSSSDSSDAWMQNFRSGNQFTTRKDIKGHVRPVRAFGAEPNIEGLPVYAVGSVGPGGGIVFITPNTRGNSTDKYFEVAPFADETVAEWCSDTETFLGPSGEAIGTGQVNTAFGQAVCTSGAIHMTLNYSNNGFSDWFLPSKDELNEMYARRASLGGFSIGIYWSSSSGGTLGASSQDFRLGGQAGVSKINTLFVRPVRAFNAPTLTAAPTTTTTVSSESYRIGEVGPAGGTVFITPSTRGNTTGLYFEIAPFASEVKRGWATGDNQRLSVPGASGYAIGDGAANTAAIARQAGNVAKSSAAVYATEYSINGFSDWFLPSNDELNEVYENLDLVRFSTDFYWSSSEVEATSARTQKIGNGDQDFSFKGNAYFVRPVRAFD